MNLARVDHIRCAEYSACTFVWMRDDMTEEEFEERIANAEREYLAALQAFDAAEDFREHIPHAPNWKDMRDRNVGEVLDEHEALVKKRNAYNETRRQALKPFSDFLEQQEGIEPFWDAEFDLHGEVDWGHRHGTNIEYGETGWPEFRLLRRVQRTKPTTGRIARRVEEEEWI